MQKYATEFYCKKCNYKCVTKFLWNQHKTTLKHNRQRLATPKKTDDTSYVCEYCGKSYKQRSGLWRHKKKCSSEKSTTQNEIIKSEFDNNTLLNEHKELKELFKNILIDHEQNNKVKEKMMNQLKEQSDIIKEMIPKLGNNTNNNFNINVFLNEQCSDAINMSEFVESLKIKLDDIQFTSTNGLVEGVCSVFLNGLKELGMNQRPIHCTDIKREILYIKDNNEWERENGKNKIKTAINDVASKQRKAIIEWKNKHPNWNETDEGKEEYIQLMQDLMIDITSESNENKIIKNIAKETIIDK
tara:strand:+ start:594 stop:1493 length:900 start_codon:yes stop_codon:yes gene_type:complete